MEYSELEDCPYCDRVYTREDKNNDDFSENTEEIILEIVKRENYNNELHDEVQNYLGNVEEEKINMIKMKSK